MRFYKSKKSGGSGLELTLALVIMLGFIQPETNLHAQDLSAIGLTSSELDHDGAVTFDYQNDADTESLVVAGSFNNLDEGRGTELFAAKAMDTVGSVDVYFNDTNVNSEIEETEEEGNNTGVTVAIIGLVAAVALIVVVLFRGHKTVKEAHESVESKKSINSGTDTAGETNTTNTTDTED